MHGPDAATSLDAERPTVIPITTAPAPDRAASVLAASLVAGAFAIVLAGVQSELFDLDRHLVPKALALHATALAALLVMIRSPRPLTVSAPAILLIAWVLWSLLSAALATNRWLAFHATAISASAVVLFHAARRIAGTPAASRALTGICAAAVLAAVLGLAQAYGADWPILADSRPPGGTFGNRNFLAHVLAIALPALLFVALRAGSAGAAAAVASTTIVAATILLTRSRAAWLATAAALAVMIAGALVARRALRGSRAWFRLALVGGAGTAGILLALALPNRLEWRSESPYSETLTRLTSHREGSGRGRVIQYRNSLELLRDAPLIGVGPGNWLVHYPRVTTPGDPSFAAAEMIPTNPWPSSDWVTLIVERGPIGALLLLAAGATAAITALGRLRLRDAPLQSVAALAALGTLVAAVVTGAFDAVLILAAPALFTFVLLGLLLPPPDEASAREIPRRASRAAAAAAVLIVTAAVLVSTGTLTAIVMTADGPARDQMARAVRFDPGNHRLRLLLATRGTCQARAPHALAAARLMPHHRATGRALRACGLQGQD